MLNYLFDYYGHIVMLALLQIIAMATPGPDSILVIRNSIVYGRKMAMYTALGIALGVACHMSFIILLMSYILPKAEIFTNYIKVIGGLYITYLGILLIFKSPSRSDLVESNNRNRFKIILLAFMTNALNPKAFLFFISVFSTMIGTNCPQPILICMGLLMVILSFTWFAGFGWILSSASMRAIFIQHINWVNMVSGIILVCIAILILFK